MITILVAPNLLASCSMTIMAAYIGCSVYSNAFVYVKKQVWDLIPSCFSQRCDTQATGLWQIYYLHKHRILLLIFSIVSTKKFKTL